ncbi:MAG: ABC transporter ATP-binding protein [Lysobacteraceae bacterium]
MNPAIECQQLSRRFPGGKGVHALDLHVPGGSIYGFLGPNGAGKTTTIRLLLGLLRPDGGEIRLFGERHHYGDTRGLRHIGALVEGPSLYPHLSGRQNLDISRRLLGLPAARIDAVLARVDLSNDADRRVRDYSLGMRQRLAIALALLGEPRLMILDEPANGLDPAGIIDLRRLLTELAAEGVTVFVSSHQLSEVEQVASHVGVLHRGRLRFEGSLGELRQRFRPRLAIDCRDPARAAEMLTNQGIRVDSDASSGRLLVHAADGSEAGINAVLVQGGIAVSRLAREVTSLEQLFFEVTDDRAGDQETIAEASA